MDLKVFCCDFFEFIRNRNVVNFVLLVEILGKHSLRIFFYKLNLREKVFRFGFIFLLRRLEQSSVLSELLEIIVFVKLSPRLSLHIARLLKVKVVFYDSKLLDLPLFFSRSLV